MSFWSVMNWVAWGLCAWIVILIVKDVIKVEKGRGKTEDQPSLNERRNHHGN